MPKAEPNSSAAGFTIEEQSPAPEGAAAVLTLKGQWVINRLAGVADRLRTALKSFKKISIRSADIETLDTAGAYTLRSIIGDRLDGAIFADQAKFASLYELVGAGTEASANNQTETVVRRPFWHHPAYFSMVDLGRMIERFSRQMIDQSVFMGHVITELMLAIVRPHRVRLAPLVNIMQRAGLEAIMIVSLTNFFVGGVLAFLGILQLQQFGVSVYTVDLVCIGVLREFAPVIAAVLMAGRSASSFAAEIGSMKMNQEIDAMRVMGIDPYEALVLPRVIGMTLMMPLVTFIGALAGMCGGMAVVWGVLGLGPSFFIQRLTDYVPFVNLFVGIIKTPFFAATIAIVGCRMGMNVKEDVISLGRQVTTAVVHAIFIVFMIDAVFAILFNGFNF
ncbi:MAG: ABC transporter permease [Asticcacaulis sp.]